MSQKSHDAPSESLVVEVVGTLLGLIIIGGIAVGILYLRGLATPKYLTGAGVVLVCLAVAMIGKTVLRASHER